MFGRKPTNVVPQARQKEAKCEIIEETRGDKKIRKIKGNCTKEQLNALGYNSPSN